MMALEFAGVTADIAGGRALDSVSFRVREGEIYLLAGRDAKTLSTLAAIAAGRTRPTLGSALVFGLPAHKRCRHVGQAVDPRGPAGALSLSAVMRLKAQRLGVIRPQAEIKDILSALAITEADRPLRQLDCLSQTKATLAQALLGQPGIIVLNDPLKGLSVDDSATFAKLLMQINAERGLAVLCTASDLQAASPFANRYGVMEGPRLARELGPPEILNRKASRYRVRTTQLERDLVLLEELLPEASASIELDPGSGQKQIQLIGCDERRLADTLHGLDSTTLELSRIQPTLDDCLFDTAGDTTWR